MKAVALTGGIASGKTTVRRYFENRGIHTICADEIARLVVKPNTYGLNQIIEHFSTSILTNDGYLNRQKLNQIIFNNPEEKTWLENLLHPLIRQRIQATIEKSTSAYTLVDIPLLTQAKLPLYPFIDAVIVVDVSRQTQLNRLCQRDHLTPEEANKRIKAQISQEERLKIADFIIDNETNKQRLNEQVEAVHQKLLHYSKT